MVMATKGKKTINLTAMTAELRRRRALCGAEKQKMRDEKSKSIYEEYKKRSRIKVLSDGSLGFSD